jgi:hypothetical protein
MQQLLQQHGLSNRHVGEVLCTERVIEAEFGKMGRWSTLDEPIDK